jgi:hypothetical protein
LASSAAGITFDLRPTKKASVESALDGLSDSGACDDEVLVEAAAEALLDDDFCFSDESAAREDVIAVGNVTPVDAASDVAGVAPSLEDVLECDLDEFEGCASPIDVAQSANEDQVLYFMMCVLFGLGLAAAVICTFVQTYTQLEV